MRIVQPNNRYRTEHTGIGYRTDWHIKIEVLAWSHWERRRINIKLLLWADDQFSKRLTVDNFGGYFNTVPHLSIPPFRLLKRAECVQRFATSGLRVTEASQQKVI